MKTPEQIADHLLRHWEVNEESGMRSPGMSSLPPLYPEEFAAMREQFSDDLREILAEENATP